MWLARRPHYHVHFTPTSASWNNQVERWFAELIDRHNQNPRPFKWTKSADQILASLNASATKRSRHYVLNFNSRD